MVGSGGRPAGARSATSRWIGRTGGWIRHTSLRQRLLAGGTAIVLIAGAALGVTLTGASSPRHHGTGHSTRSRPHTVSSTTTIKKPAHLDSHLCPLTGTEAPGGKVPQRPAEGVKIGNDPAARPQSGLDSADIVYEEMAEGGITRYLAIFQCHAAAQLGPTRSVRWDDWHILKSYGHPILAFSGGIDQWNTTVAEQTWLFDANGTFFPGASAYFRTSNRYPPENYYTSSAGLWALDKNHTPPPAQFQYAAKPPSRAGTAAQATIVAFAGGESVVWRWAPADHAWLRYYGAQPDTTPSGAQLHAANVIIQFVQTHPGPYAESGTVPDTESITTGSGKVYVLRDGRIEEGSWSCPTTGSLTRLSLRNGQAMSLAPGNTWIELVPVSYSVHITP